MCAGDDASMHKCALGGRYCPTNCTCDHTIVRCSNQDLQHFPIGLAVDTTELYLDNNQLSTVPFEEINKLTKLTKL
jgi:hypothetical protein